MRHTQATLPRGRLHAADLRLERAHGTNPQTSKRKGYSVVRVHAIAERYAQALFQAALEAQLLAPVRADCQALREAFEQDPAMTQALADRALPRAQLLSSFSVIQREAGLQELTGNIIQLVIQKGRQRLLPDIFRSFEHQVDMHQGKRDVYVASARPLRDDHRARLTATLERRTQSQIVLHEAVQPHLIGGMVVRLGSCEIDTSLYTQLKHMQQSLESLKQ